MKIPNKVPIDADITGTQLKRSFNQLIDFCKSIAPRGDNKTIRVNTTTGGTTLSTVRQAGGSVGGEGGGTATLFGKVTNVTDANNYTISAYIKSDLSDTPTVLKSCFVRGLVDELVINDVIPIQVTAIEGKDYESIQTMGAVG